MIEIKCLDDIKKLAKSGKVPKDLINYLIEDLKAVYEWVEYEDTNHEYTFETFNATYPCDYGYIALIEGNESIKQLEDLGLSGGLEGIIPENADIHYIQGEKWVKSIVIYNDSFGMILWLKNTDIFDSYASVA